MLKRKPCWHSKALASLTMALLVVGLLAFSRPADPDEKTTLPPGPGADQVKRHCLTCHREDIIVQQRLTRERWSKEIDKMVRWGVTLPAADRELLLNYLSRYYADPSVKIASPSSALPPGPGADEVKQSCIGCHGADIVSGQNLTRAQWAKEVDKMVRWGAHFKPEDRELLIEYLAAHFGPEATKAESKPEAR